MISIADRGEMHWQAWVAFGVSVTAIFGGAFYIDRQRIVIGREIDINCPHCKRQLLQLNVKLALTTGRCAECGEMVVRD